MEKEQPLEKSLYRIVLQANDDKELEKRVEDLGASFNRIREDIEKEGAREQIRH